MPADASAFMTGVVANGGNVRELPVKGKPLDQVNAYEIVQLLGKNTNGSWYMLITPRNAKGWVSATLLTIEPGVAAQVPVISATTQGIAATGNTNTAWTSYKIDQGQIQVPSTWQPLGLSKADLEHLAAQIESTNPQSAELIRQLIKSGQYTILKLIAIDPHVANNIANVSVLGVPRPSGIGENELFAQLSKAISRGGTGLTIISSDMKQRVNGLPAGRIVYEQHHTMANGQRGTLRGVQWYIISPTSVYVITITGQPDDTLIATADHIGHSFTTQGTANSSPAPSAPGTEARRQVTNGGNLRRTPQIVANNVIGQVCPGDQVVIVEQSTNQNWAHIQIVETAPDCDPNRVPLGSEGWVSASLLGPVTAPETPAAPEPLEATELPPSLLITKLVPFSEPQSGLSGLQPENWTLSNAGRHFQISSSHDGLDSFIGMIIQPNEYPEGGASEASRNLIDEWRDNFADGPAPVIHEDTTTADGSRILLVTVSDHAPDSTQSIRITIYARTTVTLHGVVLAVATVPEAMFAQEEALIRQMVDSVMIIPRTSF